MSRPQQAPPEAHGAPLPSLRLGRLATAVPAQRGPKQGSGQPHTPASAVPLAPLAALALCCAVTVLFLLGEGSFIPAPSSWSDAAGWRESLEVQQECSQGNQADSAACRGTDTVLGQASELSREQQQAKGPEKQSEGPTNAKEQQSVGPTTSDKEPEQSNVGPTASAKEPKKQTEPPAKAKEPENQNVGPTIAKEPEQPEYPVPITVLEENSDSGLCLDGSPPAYHLSPGWGSGALKWLVFLEGGGWCRDESECHARTRNRLGSSKEMNPTVDFGGILSNSSRANPLFHNWNAVFVRYCDGGSFSGRERGSSAGAVHVDGQRVFERVVLHLMSERGMSRASHVLLAGASAGGLAALLQCDRFRTLVESQQGHQQEQQQGPSGAATEQPLRRRLSSSGAGPQTQGSGADRMLRTSQLALQTQGSGGAAPGSHPKAAMPGTAVRRALKSDTVSGPESAAGASSAATAESAASAESSGLPGFPVVKCLSDGGLFPAVQDVQGNHTLRHMFSSVAYFHNPQLSPRCWQAHPEGAKDRALCLLPEHFLAHIETPFFLLNSLYDMWMIQNAFMPQQGVSAEWAPCREDLRNCSEGQLQRLHGYRAGLVEVVGKAMGAAKSPSGAFLSSCRTHSLSLWGPRWHGPGAPRVNGLTAAEAVAAWFERERGRKFDYDCEYPCNPSCFPYAIGY